MQRMTDFCQIVSMSRLFETLERRVFQYPTLRNLTVPCMGLLRFSLFEAVEKSVRYIIRAIQFSPFNFQFFQYPRILSIDLWLCSLANSLVV